MTHAPLVCDLAVAVADVLHGRDDAIEAADALIGGYVSVTPLEDEEAGAARGPGDGQARHRGHGHRLAAAGSTRTTPPTPRAASPGPAPSSTPSRRWGSTPSRGGSARPAGGCPTARPATGALLERRRRALPRSPLFYDHPVHLVRGEGVWLFDPDDRRYLDCYNNVPVVGHGHPRVVQAVAQQQRLLATHSRYLHEAIVELAERLKATLPPALDAVMVVNSGSEANDLAWRIARAATGRSGAVVTAYAYHGLTEATHALSPEEWAKGSSPPTSPPSPRPTGTAAPTGGSRTAGRERYAAHMDDAAPGARRPRLRRDVPGPGLHRRRHPVAPARLPARSGPAGAGAGRACWWPTRSRPVTAGPGRSLWSFQPSGIEPDMVVMGKPMGNGFPVAALVVRSQLLAAVPEEVELFSTFGGNPVACAAALAVLAVIEDEGLVANAAEVGSYLRQGLETLAGRHPVIGDVRGEGLLLGVELVDEEREPAAGPRQRVTEAMRERGILLSTTGPAGNVLKIRPPLVFQREHADLLLQTLDEVLATVG